MTNRVMQEWTEYAQESVSVEEIKGVFYGYASELGVLRILAKYTANGTAQSKGFRIGYSSNLKTWYASLEPRF